MVFVLISDLIGGQSSWGQLLTCSYHQRGDAKRTQIDAGEGDINSMMDKEPNGKSSAQTRVGWPQTPNCGKRAEVNGISGMALDSVVQSYSLVAILSHRSDKR